MTGKDFPDLHAARMAATFDMNNAKAIFELPLLFLDAETLVDAAYRLKTQGTPTYRGIAWIQGEPWLLYYREGN